MLYAIDRTRATVTSAEDAATHRRGGRRYVCPTCGKPVRLHAGPKNRPYFAHQANVASPDCENYHPSGEYVRGEGGLHTTPLRPLSLYLTVDDRVSRRSKWTIELLVPRSSASVGVVFVTDGISGTIPVNCSSLTESGRRIPVRIVTRSYEVRTNDDVDPQYRRRLTAVTPGFANEVPNVFRYSENGGRRIELGKPLYWGRGYYLVWPAAMVFSVPTGVWWEEIVQSDQWKCARIEIPSDPNNTTVAWANDLLGRDIEHPPVVLSLINPASARWLADESILIEADAEVVVGVAGERGSEMPGEMRLTTPASSGSHLLLLPARNPVIVSLGSLPIGFSIVELDDADETELTLNVATASPTPSLTGPSLQFRRGSNFFSFPSHSVAAELALKGARDGDRELVGMTIPVRATVRIVTQRGTKSEPAGRELEWDIQEQNAYPETYRAEFQSQVLNAVQHALNSTSSVDVDFGNFGLLRLPGASSLEPALEPLFLGASLRQRIEWIMMLAQVGLREGAGITAPELSQALDAVNRAGRIALLRDRALIESLATLQLWTPKLMPHLRELAVKLQSLAGVP